MALVTGASSGIGTATAQAPAALGATVALAITADVRPEVQTRHHERFAQTQKMEATDIAETIAFVISRPRHMSINEVPIRPTEQDN